MRTLAEQDRAFAGAVMSTASPWATAYAKMILSRASAVRAVGHCSSHSGLKGLGDVGLVEVLDRRAPELRQHVMSGDLLTLTNVRDFEWRSNSDYTERWTTRSYDLATLRTVDLFMSYWAGPEMAHVILSFGFEGGEQLAWSIEVRRRTGGEFHP